MTITLPGWLNVQEWTTNNWFIAAAVVQAIYGLITHHHSMVQVRKWNKANPYSKEVDCNDCTSFFFVRMFISIPWRIACFGVGICVIAIAPIFRLLLGLNPLNDNVKYAMFECFSAAAKWHLPPEEMYGIWRGRF